MDDLKDFWNKNTTRIPDDKGQSLYATEKEAQFPRNSVVCDLGGGTGTDGLYFASRGHSVTLVDIADEALAKAETHAKERGLTDKLKVAQCDFSFGKLPLDSDAYDVVYSRLALHYFEPQVTSRLFAEIYRILRPGGRTYLTLKSPEDAAEMAFLATTAIEEEAGLFNEKGRLKSRYTIERLKEILTDSGIPESAYSIVSYTEKLGNENDVVKSGNSEFIVNEITIQK
jgi:ubiquinone/menaquinone biosynthesis C-methylase UbiE